MSTSYTHSNTFTRTHARYLASKVAADLRQMQLFYGGPSDSDIEDYIEELTELLVGGYLSSVDYGFHGASGWAVALNYTVRSDGTLNTDDRAGRIPVGVNISGCRFYSYLRRSSKWWNLTQAERDKINESISIKRGGANEPKVGSGVWVQDKIYSSNGTSFTRLTLKAA
jgi:Bacterial HORMA domain family 1